ncbi:MAG TPA: HAD family hydrolase [Gemmatimonadaceae bacterium]|nr:HAD family hydrolase [Gemmatimonadaceae bacterium]
MTSRSLRAVIFDVDGTLYDTVRMRLAFAPWIAGQFARAPVATVQALRVLRAYRRAHETLRGERHPDLEQAQRERTAFRLGLPVDRVGGIVSTWFERAPITAVGRAARPGLVEALQRLRTAGMRLAVVSDYPPQAKLDALGVAPLIDAVIWAQHPLVGALKPDPAGLLAALRTLDVEAERALYVGDRPEVDEAVALAAGCRAAVIGARAPLRSATPRFSDVSRLADWCLDGHG